MSDHILKGPGLTDPNLKAHAPVAAPKRRTALKRAVQPVLLVKTCWDNFPGIITAETAEAEPLEGRLFPESEEPNE